jgi:transposase
MMYRLKQLGDSLYSRTFERQVTEAHVRVAILNTFTYLGHAGICPGRANCACCMTKGGKKREGLPKAGNITIRDITPRIMPIYYTNAVEVERLQAKVRELEGERSKDSHNSSNPPSSDGLAKPPVKPDSLRKSGEHPNGGQPGHPGQTLKQVENPDRVLVHLPPAHCPACQGPLGEATEVESRQVFDLPPLRFEVTEHQVWEATCACGRVCRGEFPEGVSAPVQYGPAALAAAVHLTQYPMMPVQRTAQLMGDFFELPMAEGTVLAAAKEAAVRLAPTVAAIGQAIQAAEVAHADETGLRVAGALHWMHVLVTPLLTWVACHAKRGKQAFDELGILAAFLGTLIHDGWKPYRDLLYKHGLCNAHHLRELTYLFEDLGQAWAGRMIDLLLSACHEVGEAGAPLSEPRRVFFLLRETLIYSPQWGASGPKREAGPKNVSVL